MNLLITGLLLWRLIFLSYRVSTNMLVYFLTFNSHTVKFLKFEFLETRGFISNYQCSNYREVDLKIC